MRKTVVKMPGLDAPGTVRGRHLVTSVQVHHGPGHDTIRVFNRGGLAGELIVQSGDGVDVALRLIPDGEMD